MSISHTHYCPMYVPCDCFCDLHCSSIISMGYCKKDVTTLLTYWSYLFLALTHQYGINHENFVNLIQQWALVQSICLVCSHTYLPSTVGTWCERGWWDHRHRPGSCWGACHRGTGASARCTRCIPHRSRPSRRRWADPWQPGRRRRGHGWRKCCSWTRWSGK